ncbi:MAG TPA: glycosyltransferase family 39 protein [Gemmatimonadaceae bacterium]|nr:glycosyltransferase family 39 protein [Gemmatimonadaceae bacterium]
MTVATRHVAEVPSRTAGATPRPPFAVDVVLTLAAAVLLAHVLTNLFSPYGVHRDEFLYLAMGRHLRFFHMDFPPFIAIVAEVSRVFGDSLVVLRFAPALAGSALVVLAALLAREFGGGRYAQLLAAIAVATVPIYLRPGNLFQPVVFDQLWWTLALFALARLGREGFRGDARWWLVLGAAGGIGLLTKFSIFFLGAGVLVALLLGAQRRTLLTPWPWIALAIALVIGSPSIVGQVQLGFPVVSQMRDLQGSQLEHVSSASFIAGQFLMLGPAFVIAVTGAGGLLIARRYRAYRPVAWASLTAFVVVLLLHGKPYYVGPIYPALVGAGAAVIGGWAEHARTAQHTSRAWIVRGAALLLVVAYGALTLPLGLPIVPPVSMARYAAALGLTAAVKNNQGEVLSLPQDYADMLGWEAQVAAVARVYRALPDSDRTRAVLIADNYGEAGAIDYYGPKYGLPSAIAATGSYWFFGPGTKPGDVVIKVGGSRDDLTPFFRSVALAARVNEPWVVPEERDLPIWLGRQPYRTLQAVWPRFAGQN